VNWGKAGEVQTIKDAVWGRGPSIKVLQNITLREFLGQRKKEKMALPLDYLEPRKKFRLPTERGGS